MENQEILRGFVKNPRKKFPQKKTFENERYRTPKINYQSRIRELGERFNQSWLLTYEEIFQKSIF